MTKRCISAQNGVKSQLFSPGMSDYSLFSWGVRDPSLSSGVFFRNHLSVIPAPRLWTGIHTLRIVARTINNCSTPGSGPTDAPLLTFTLTQRCCSPAFLNDRMAGRRKRTLRTLPVPKGIQGRRPCRYPIFDINNREEASNSAQNSLPTVTLLGS